MCNQPRAARFRSSGYVQKTFQVPHTPIEQFSLGNGLRVVLNEDHSVPVVSVAVYYDVGSRNEREGRTGLEAAHPDAVRAEDRNVRGARRRGQRFLLGAAYIADFRIA